MIRYVILFSIIVLSDIQAWAACEQIPNVDSIEKGVTAYSHTHTVYHSVDGKMKADDYLIVWNKGSKELCFSIKTISNEYRECFLDGKATQLNINEYGYTQNKCSVSLTVVKGRIKVNAMGSGQNYCVAEDLGEDNGCGMNTFIDSAIYKQIKP